LCFVCVFVRCVLRGFCEIVNWLRPLSLLWLKLRRVLGAAFVCVVCEVLLLFGAFPLVFLCGLIGSFDSVSLCYFVYLETLLAVGCQFLCFVSSFVRGGLSGLGLPLCFCLLCSLRLAPLCDLLVLGHRICR